MIPVAGSACNTDEIAIDNDDDDEMLEDGAADGPTDKAADGAHESGRKGHSCCVYRGLMREGDAPSGALARFKSKKIASGVWRSKWGPVRVRAACQQRRVRGRAKGADH